MAPTGRISKRTVVASVGPRLVVMAAALLLVLVSPVGAQDGDPYGSTTTTTEAGSDVTLALTTESGPRGTEVGVFACGYRSDAPEGSITFDGGVVVSGLVVDADGCLAPSDDGGRPTAQTGAPVSFRVPGDARPGNRNVCAVVAGYETPCARFQVRQDAEVAGVAVDNEQRSSLPVIGSGPFGGSLPRTGIALGALVALAVALLVAGRRALAESRRRRGDAY